MSFIKEFREFISRGSVIDIAVGVIIGAAFNKIVSSLVADIVMPPLGLLLTGVDFKSWKITLRDAEMSPAGDVTREAVTMNIGNFLQTTLDFLILAFAVFLLVRFINHIRRLQAAKPASEQPAAPPTREEQLLTEIRDELKRGRP